MVQDKFHKMNLMIGERLRLARKEAGLTQKDLAEKLGFKSRQILDNIEAGIRKVTADELLVIMEALGKTLDYFTDPFLVLEEKAFSWRADRESRAVDDYEKKARSLVGTFRHFCEMLETPPSPIVPTLSITSRSSYEEAMDAGERIVREFQLGEIPSERLAEEVEKRLGIHILYVDAPQGVSGAACHLSNMNFILINRNEPLGRRNYDMAHELFHVLTWNELPPEKIDVVFYEKKTPRVEQLAENFSAALLMPADALKRLWKEEKTSDITDRINSIAKKFKVSSIALKNRLRNTWMIADGDLLRMDDSRLKWVDTGPKPLLYSKAFVENLHFILDRGRLSVRRAAELLDCMIEDLTELFQSYQLKAPFDL